MAHVALLDHISSLAAMRTHGIKIAPAGWTALPFTLDFDIARRAGVIKRALPPAYGAKLAVVANKRATADAWLIVSRHCLPPYLIYESSERFHASNPLCETRPKNCDRSVLSDGQRMMAFL